MKRGRFILTAVLLSLLLTAFAGSSVLAASSASSANTTACSWRVAASSEVNALIAGQGQRTVGDVHLLRDGCGNAQAQYVPRASEPLDYTRVEITLGSAGVTIYENDDLPVYETPVYPNFGGVATYASVFIVHTNGYGSGGTGTDSGS